MRESCRKGIRRPSSSSWSFLLILILALSSFMPYSCIGLIQGLFLDFVVMIGGHIFPILSPWTYLISEIRSHKISHSTSTSPSFAPAATPRARSATERAATETANSAGPTYFYSSRSILILSSGPTHVGVWFQFFFPTTKSGGDPLIHGGGPFHHPRA